MTDPVPTSPADAVPAGDRLQLVTGATGFIGRHVAARLLRAGEVVVAVARDPASPALAELAGSASGRGRLEILAGDLTRAGLGLSDETLDRLRGRVEHLVHAAGLYDLEASDADLRAVNVEGTRHALEAADALGARTFHHLSSIAVAGRHRGVFTEEMLDEGQKLPHAYHRSKLEAERLVRARSAGAWRIYRPGIVVGDSRTGVADKADGPYHLFKAIQRTRSVLPQWFPLVGPELGTTHIVPVDYVADALVAILRLPGLDGRTFHLVPEQPQRIAEAINVFAEAAHAPRLVLRVDPRLAGRLPLALFGRAVRSPPLDAVRRQLLDDLGIPEALLPHMTLEATFDASGARGALEGTGIRAPELEDYAWRLWDFWERRLDPADADGTLEARVRGRVVLITGASSGIGRVTAARMAAAGAVTVLVARSAQRLEDLRREIEQAGGVAHARPADLSDPASIDALVDGVLADLGGVDVLVNNAGRSIRRSTALSYERLHDYERTIALNYLGAVRLTMGLLPGMRRRRRGHVVNVSSIGVQVNPPRFSAYVASKAALDAWTRVVASETVGDRVTFTTVHMPLVRTPMIAPTPLYEAFPTISAEDAAEMICDAIRRRPKQVGTRLGTLAEVAQAVAPRAVDQLLHAAYRVFPDSAAAHGRPDGDAPASDEAVALTRLLRGVRW